jgi:hypothetical protein
MVHYGKINGPKKIQKGNAINRNEYNITTQALANDDDIPYIPKYSIYD